MYSAYKPSRSVVYSTNRIKPPKDQEKKHPVREELEKCLGTYQLTALIEEDLPTLALFKNMPGMVAFLCSIKLGDRIVSQGRGSARFAGSTRWIERTIRSAFYGSLTDSIARLTRIDALLDVGVKTQALDLEKPEARRLNEASESEISDKQRSYILEMAGALSEEEYQRYGKMVDSLSRSEASAVIQELKQR